MSTKTLRAALAIVTVVLMAASSSMAAPDGGDDARSGGSRSTPIDGQFRDNITSEQNFTLYDDAVVSNGQLTLDRTYWYDDFNRFQLGPDWTVVNGTVTVQGSMLRTNATFTENATALRALDLHDLELTVEMAPGLLRTKGPVISLVGARPAHVWFEYEHRPSPRVLIGYNDQAGRHVSSTGSVTLETDTFVTARVMVDGGLISISLGGAPIIANLGVTGNFTGLALTARPDESAAWDNVSVKKLEASGYAVSAPVQLPVDTYWDTLGHRRVDVQDGTVKLTLLNGSDSKPLEGFADIKPSALDLTDPGKTTYINPVLVSSVILRIDLMYVGKEASMPSLDYWYISWSGDAPRWVRTIERLTLYEDTPVRNVTDVRAYFDDRFTSKDDLDYSIRDPSNILTVRPYLEGYNLSIDLPTKDWTGTETFMLRASDGTLYVESNVAIVEVLAVDDPPTIRTIPAQTVTEDEPFELNITEYIDDVDTPKAQLTLRTLSTHAEIAGHSLEFMYDRGGFTDRVEVEVSDGSGTALINISVTVVEHDDPPAIGTIYEVLVNEDEPRTMDLAPFVSDEDTPIEYLRLEVVDGGDNVTIEDRMLYVNFTKGGGQVTYVLHLSDNTTTVNGELKVRAVAVNDKPRILTVGGVTPAGGIVAVTIEELGTMRLDLVVVDEEGSAISLTAITDWAGATIDGQTLVLDAPLGDLGVKGVQVVASDGSLTDGVTVNVEVTNRNDPPTEVSITKPLDNITVKEGENVTVDAYARDPDAPYGDVLTYKWYVDDVLVAEGKPKTLTNLSVARHKITLKVSDGEVEVAFSINITVQKKDGGNGNGNGNGDGDGDDDDGGGKGMLYAGIGIVVAVVVVLALVMMMRGRKGKPAPAQKAAVAPPPKAKASSKGAEGAPRREAAPAAAAPQQGAPGGAEEDEFQVKTYEEVVGGEQPKE